MNDLELKEYIRNNEVAYQCIDELMEFSNKENDYVLANLMANVCNVNRIERDDIKGRAFNDLVEWSTEDDILFLLDDWMLLCLPKDAYKF